MEPDGESDNQTEDDSGADDDDECWSYGHVS